MACNCSKSNSNLIWIHTDSNGHEKVYTSEVQAKAAWIRSGRSGSIRSQTR